MKYLAKIVLSYGLAVTIPYQPQDAEPANSITKNDMTVTWKHKEARVHFEMKAPTNGWVAIGFNTSQSITGTYLLMGRVVNGVAEVVEHYTLSPGKYKPLETLGAESAVEDVAGSETQEGTTLKFSLPISALNTYARNLSRGETYVLLMAFSREDDFQHHSMMRTAEKVKF